jgi:gas vesicle protein
MADNDNGVGSFGWFLAGLGIGALVGVLYAPKSGRETRDDLVASALEAKDRANQMYGQGREQVNQYVAQGKQKASEYVDKGAEYYDKGRTQWSQYVEKGKGVIQNQADAVNEAVQAGQPELAEHSGEFVVFAILCELRSRLRATSKGPGGKSGPFACGRAAESRYRHRCLGVVTSWMRDNNAYLRDQTPEES